MFSSGVPATKWLHHVALRPLARAAAEGVGPAAVVAVLDLGLLVRLPPQARLAIEARRAVRALGHIFAVVRAVRGDVMPFRRLPSKSPVPPPSKSNTMSRVLAGDHRVDPARRA